MAAKKKPARFTKTDYDELARSDVAEFDRRKTSEHRIDLEKRWEQVDQQIKLEKIKKNKMLPAWFPDTPVPTQANALEVLGADVDQLQFPDNHEFFSVNAEINEEYFDALIADIEFFGKDEEATKYDQEDINAITQAALIHAHKQYDFRGQMAQIDVEGLKYGTMCARLRPASRYSFTNDYRGISRFTNKLPALLPISIKHTYLDDKAIEAINSGMIMGSREMFTYKQQVKDIQMAAAKGNSDTQRMDGGWRKDEVSKLEAPDKDGYIDLLEVEGDMIIPRRSTEDIYLPNMIVTHAISKGGPVVIRVRENKLPFNSLMHGTYFKENIGVYGVSPLMKGAPISAAASDMLNVMQATAWMNAGPPIGWNRNDIQLRARGGPDFHPYALWDSMSDIKVHGNLGSISDARDAYLALVKQYEEITGVSSPRTGAQTKSHQTAFAVSSEVTRGQTRTVNFVRSKNRGLTTNVLNGELEIMRRDMPKQAVYVPRFKSYVIISGKSLPKTATMEVLGAGNPAEQAQKDQIKIAVLTNLVKLEAQGISQQLGGKPIDIDVVREQMLEIGIPQGDIAKFFKDPATAQPPQVPGAGGEAPAGNLPGNVQQIAQNIGFQDA